MTTIAFKDGFVVSDSRAYSGDKNPIGNKDKIRWLDDGRLFACSSCIVGEPERLFRKTNEHGTNYDFGENLNVQAIVFNQDGTFQYLNKGRTYTAPLTAEYGAIGSGEDYALAALVIGKSAIEAIEIAIRLDPWTEAPINAIRLPWDF